MLKSQIVNQALAQTEISGLTRSGSPEETSLCLSELEQMLAMWLAGGIDIGYRFSEADNPDINDESGIPLWTVRGVVSNLAVSILEYFGKPVPETILKKSKAGKSVIETKTYVPHNVSYPGGMPRGQGNQKYGYNHSSFYPKTTNPLTDNFIYLTFGNVENPRPIDMRPYLTDGETITNITEQSADCLTVSCIKNNDGSISYRVKSIRNSSAQLKVTFTVTTSCGRITTREQWFSIKAASLDNC